MTRPVSLWENEQVEGYALCAEFILNDNRAKVDALRQRQAAFEATLPTDPEAIVDAALRLMHPNGATYPGKFEEALHMAKALRPMIRDLDTANPGPDRDALLWFADQVMWALELLSRDLDHLSAILGNAKRIAREAEYGCADTRPSPVKLPIPALALTATKRPAQRGAFPFAQVAPIDLPPCDQRPGRRCQTKALDGCVATESVSATADDPTKALWPP